VKKRVDALGSGQGFTVIELLTALAITALLIALGFSAYRTFSVRSEVAHGIELAREAKKAVEDGFKRDGEPPADIVSASTFPARSRGSIYLASLHITDGRIDLTYGAEASPAISGRKLSLTPYETAGLNVVWICGNAIPGPGLQPLGFAGGGRRAVQIVATIEPRYLPPACR
jgi:type IV pilus assembly protein PilA